MSGLWDSFLENLTSDTEILSKTKSSKKTSIEDKFKRIEANVYSILGSHKDDTLVITSKEEFHNYITKAIECGIITIDTETNNSLDPLTCKLMGLCLYVDKEKQCYIPVNHVDSLGNKLNYQLTEKDIYDELSRLSNVKKIFHNAGFDIRVIEYTCNIRLDCYWDTQIGARVLNENEKSNLKEQYLLHIDKNHGKYSIEHLFEKEKYEIFDPSLFALYAATDAMMTYKLYKYQLNEFLKEENSKLYKLFRDIEMPQIDIIINMEDTGIDIDEEYAKRLSTKYHNILDTIDVELQQELNNLKPKIDEWRLTSEANEPERIYAKDLEYSNDKFPFKDNTGVYKLGKSKSEKLPEDINVESSTQLSILLYDVLKAEVVDKKTPRGTSEAILDLMPYDLCKILIKRKKINKLSRDFIDALPAQEAADGRIHCRFNQYGADTGRYSSERPNLQQIPSHNKEIRMLFKASTLYDNVECNNNLYKFSILDEVQVDKDVWKKVKDLQSDDRLYTSESTFDIIVDIKDVDDYRIVYVM